MPLSFIEQQGNDVEIKMRCFWQRRAIKVGGVRRCLPYAKLRPVGNWHALTAES